MKRILLSLLGIIVAVGLLGYYFMLRTTAGQDYHATVTDIAELTRTTGVGMTALYHTVPGPRNALMENIFKREIEDNMLLTEDSMWFRLPPGSDAILIE